MTDDYEWTAALRRPDGELRPVGVAYSEDQHSNAQELATWEFCEWKRDAGEVGRIEDVVLIRRCLGEWEVMA